VLPDMTAGYDGSSPVPVLAPQSKDGGCNEATLPCKEGPALRCKDLNDWLLPEGVDYQSLLVRRPQTPVDFQHVDRFAASVAAADEYGGFSSIQEHIALPRGTPKDHFALDLSEKARRLAARAVQHGLPKDLGCRIAEDFQKIGTVLAEVAPAPQMILKLEALGEKTCARWHRDYYVGRAVVTYNSCGTQYVADDNVNFQHFDCGSCTDLIRDETQIFSADVGDILFMKGLHFPGSATGLVHRSPPKQYHASGEVVNRLLLKVDLDNVVDNDDDDDNDDIEDSDDDESSSSSSSSSSSDEDDHER